MTDSRTPFTLTLRTTPADLSRLIHLVAESVVYGDDPVTDRRLLTDLAFGNEELVEMTLKAHRSLTGRVKI